MALGTIAAKGAVVDILLPVTGNTGRRQRGILHVFLGVAAVTADARMGSRQRIFRIPAMIESDAAPADG